MPSPDQRFREEFQNEPIRSPLEYEQREAARRTQADMGKLLKERVGELEARLHEPCRAEVAMLRERIAELEAGIVWLCDHFVSWQGYSDHLVVEEARSLPTTLEGILSAAKDDVPEGTFGTPDEWIADVSGP